MKLSVISLQRTKVCVFSDSVLCLGKVLQHPESNEAWKNSIARVRAERSYRDYDAINGESTEFEWNIFPGFTTLQLCDKINDLLSDLQQTPETFTGRVLFMSMFKKGNKEECVANARVVKVLAKKFGIGQWSFIGPGSEKKSGILPRIVHKELGIILRKKCSWNSQESGHPTFRAKTPFPGVYSKAKDMEKCRYTSPHMISQLTQFFALFFPSISSVSTEQWQPCLKNLTTIKMDRVSVRFSWVNQLFPVKLRQRFP